MRVELDLTIFPGLPAGVQDADVAIPSHVADLAKTFPLLFFMLAADIGPFSRRAEALRLAEQGKPLADVSAAYGLPLCLRRIAPQSCREPLPWFAWSKDASAVLGNHIPKDPAEAANWLAAVFWAARNCDERFGLWVARQLRLAKVPRLDVALLRPLALYAWCSLQAQSPLASITVTPWSPGLSLGRTIRETETWLARLSFLVQAGDYPISDPWLSGGRGGDFEIVPIVTLDGLLSERLAMRNCLHRYAEKLASGNCRLFAVKAGNSSVGTLELVVDRNGAIGISQLKGPGNVGASPEVEAAVKAWFERQREARPMVPVRMLDLEQIASRLSGVLTPYQRAIGETAAWPTLTIGSLRSALERLRRLTSRSKQPASRVLEPLRAPAANPGHALPISPQSPQVLAALRASLGDDIFSAWFRSLQVHGFEAGVVRVSVPVRFLARWIETHYGVELLACCAAVWPGAARVAVSVRPPAIAPADGLGEQPCAPAFALDQAPERMELPHPVSMEAVLRGVSQRYQLSRADILSQRRHRIVVRARQIAMYLAFRLSGRSLPAIGRRLGDRDHTTVLHAIRKIRGLMTEDPAFEAEIAGLERTILAETPERHAQTPPQPIAGA